MRIALAPSALLLAASLGLAPQFAQAGQSSGLKIQNTGQKSWVVTLLKKKSGFITFNVTNKKGATVTGKLDAVDQKFFMPPGDGSIVFVGEDRYFSKNPVDLVFRLSKGLHDDPPETVGVTGSPSKLNFKDSSETYVRPGKTPLILLP